MRIVSAPKNYLSKLEEIRVKIKNKSTPKEEKRRLSIEAAKLVLPIWEIHHKNNYPYLAIQAAEEYLDDPTEENKERTREAVNDAYVAAVSDVGAAYYACTAFAAYAAAYAAYSVNYSSIYAVDYAIKATKLFFKIE